MGLVPKETVLHGMAQQCGRCGHRHRGWTDVRTMPVCDVCDCKQFRPHDKEEAAMQAAEAADALAFAGRERLLTGYAAQGIKQVLIGVEREFHARGGWEVPSVFGVLYAGTPKGAIADDEGRTCAAIIAEPLQLPDGLYEAAGGDPAKMIVSVSALGEKQPGWFDRFRQVSGIDPDDPMVAWWSITCLDMIDADSGRVYATVRELVCVDVDERVYTVARQQGGVSPRVNTALGAMPPVGVTLDVLDVYAAKARRLVAAGALAAGPATGLPMMTEGLLRCMRLCRNEMALKAVFNGAGPGNDDG